jgi:hypothetical protein
MQEVRATTLHAISLYVYTVAAAIADSFLLSSENFIISFSLTHSTHVCLHSVVEKSMLGIFWEFEGK